MVSNPILTRRALVLAKIETTFGTDAAPTASDALMVSAPQFTANLNVLERNFVRDDISPLARRVGRKVAGMTFGVEIRGNETVDTGLIGDAPRIGRLLRACGFAESATGTGTGRIGSVRDVGTHAVVASWAVGGTPTGDTLREYMITCVLAGASATAKLRVSELNGYDTGVLRNETFKGWKTSTAGTLTFVTTDPLSVTLTVGGTWVAGDTIAISIGGKEVTYTVPGGGTATTAIATALELLIEAITDVNSSAAGSVITITFANDLDGIVVTSGVTALDLGDSGATATPTWTGSLALGQQWRVSVSPTGIVYTPVSSSFEGLTLWLYMDGILHKMSGCQGTFTFNAEAGAYGTLEFTFTGNYTDPIDAKMISGTFENINLSPPIFELAKLVVDSHDVSVQALTYNQNNQIVPRIDANFDEGYNGSRLVSRSPEGGINPEVRQVGEYDFWAKMSAASSMHLSTRIGQDAGNTFWFSSPNAVYSGLTYSDRDGIRVFDAGLSFSRESGNDEVRLIFS